MTSVVELPEMLRAEPEKGYWSPVVSDRQVPLRGRWQCPFFALRLRERP
jgi:hypothetical protein